MAEKKPALSLDEKIAKLKNEISQHENVLRTKRAKLRELEQKKALADAQKNAALVKTQADEIAALKKQLAAQQAASQKTVTATPANTATAKTATAAKPAASTAKPATAADDSPSLEVLMNAAKKQ